MTPRLILASSLLLVPALTAQVSSPKGYLDKEGNSTATFSLGDYADGRFQYIDGTHRGSAMTIKGTDYRLGNYAYSASTGTGRSFSNVQVRVADGDLSMFGSTFTKNYLSAPTLVFSAAVSWPTQTGKPGAFPAQWSMKFPFTTGWSYSGTKDICFDYTFAGGKLMNNAAWATSSNRPLYKDAQNFPTWIAVNSTNLGYAGSGVGCNDRGVTHVNGATISSRVTVYGADYSTASFRNTIQYRQTGSWFGPNKPALTVIGLRALRDGFAFPGVTCNKVHVDFSLPVLNVPGFTNASGSLVTLNLSAKNPGLKNLSLVSQTVWADTKTGQNLLSNAATLIVPETPRSQPVSLLYHYNSASKTGFLSSSRSYQPVRRIVQ